MGLDTLPLYLGVTVYVWFWPGKYLTPETKIAPSDTVDEGDRVEGDGLEMNEMEKNEDVFRS